MDTQFSEVFHVPGTRGIVYPVSLGYLGLGEFFKSEVL
jgi:hypothetical protein